MQQDSPMREDIPPPEGPGAILAPTPAPAGEPQEAPDAGTATIMQKASWGSSAVTDQLMGNGIGSLAMPIYNITLGVSPELLGWALAIPRVFDAVIDPLIGNLSDNTRSRWGRRRPWIAVGGILCALFFTLLWIPPLGLSKTGLCVYFLVASFVYYFAWAIFSIPRQALGYELSTDYNDRTRVMAWNLGFAYAAGALMIPWLYRLTFWGSSGSAMGTPESNHQVMIGVRYVAIGASLLILLFVLPTIFFCRERVESQAHAKSRLIPAFAATITNYPFLLLIGMTFFLSLGISICSPINLYVNIYYICQGDRKFGSELAGIVGTVGSLMGAASIFVIPWIAARVGKKPVIIGGMLLAIIGFASTWLLFTPKHPYWQVIPSMLWVPGFTCGYVLCGSIMADICDLDELTSFKRREGMFGAAYACLGKAIGAAQMVLAGYLLVWVGYKDVPMQSIETLFRLRYMFVLAPTVCLLISAIFIFLLPVNEKRVREVRGILDARKRKAQEDLAATNV